MDAIERFLSRVDSSGGDAACWPWTGARTRQGYGRWKPTNRFGPVYAHRLMFELTHGGIAPGAYVLHTCDNPPCVNPAHLWTGSQTDNMRDAAAKGRTAHQRRPERAPRGERHYRARVTADQVRAIRTACADGESQDAVALRFEISQKQVSRIVNRESWAHIE